jgi:hypothetical protein
MRCFAEFVGCALVGFLSGQAHSSEKDGMALDRVALKGGDFLILPVTIKGKSYPFVLSTGTKTTVYDISLRNLVGERTGADWLQGPEKDILVSCHRPPEAFVGRIPLPREGSVQLGDLSWARQMYGQDERGLLGMDFVRSYRICVVLDSNRLTIQGGIDQESFFQLPLGAKSEAPQLAPDLVDGGLLEPGDVVVSMGQGCHEIGRVVVLAARKLRGTATRIPVLLKRSDKLLVLSIKVGARVGAQVAVKAAETALKSQGGNSHQGKPAKQK